MSACLEPKGDFNYYYDNAKDKLITGVEIIEVKYGIFNVHKSVVIVYKEKYNPYNEWVQIFFKHSEELDKIDLLIKKIRSGELIETL